MKKISFLLLFTITVNNILLAQDKINPAARSGLFVLGITDTIYSTVLGEKRPVNIYLPEGYSPDSSTTYPVIYLLDGGAEEDFIHISGLVRFNTTPWINRFPQSIVVGIESVNRKRDFTYATPDLDFLTKLGFDKKPLKERYGGSEKFISFIQNELQPFIQQQYKTAKEKTIIGESLGGLLATEILLKKPSLFDTYIIVSPSLWWGNQSLLMQARALLSQQHQNKKVYVGAANKNEDSMMFNVAKKLAGILTASGKFKTVQFDYLAEETHATIIHQAVYNAFRLLYPIKK